MSAILEKLSPILPSQNIETTESFWTMLGFHTVYKDTNEYLLMKREGAETHFWLNTNLNPALNDAGAYLRPANIDALDAEWGQLGIPDRGVPRLVRAEDKPWGMRELALVDVDGNLIRAGQELPNG